MSAHDFRPEGLSLTDVEQRILHAALRRSVKIIPDERDQEVTRLRAALRRIVNDRPQRPGEYDFIRFARVRKIAREALK